MSDIFDVQMAETYDDWYKTPKGRLVDKIEKEVIYEFFKAPTGDEDLRHRVWNGKSFFGISQIGSRSYRCRYFGSHAG